MGRRILFLVLCCGCQGVGQADDANASDVDTGDVVADSGPPPNFDLPEDVEWPTHQEGGTSWTFLVYMIADNNLEDFALPDLDEMMSVGSTNAFNIVVQIDRSVKFTNEGIGGLSDWTTAKRLRVEKGTLTELEDLGELNMGDPEVLADFINWGVTAYPANRYALIFWDHGSSWTGFGGDESQKPADRLPLVELSDGIDAGMTQAGLSQFALVGFDACLMATYETAVMLRPVSEYMLASEETEPGHGWDYAALAQTLADPTRDGAQLGKDLLDGYLAQATAHGKETDITLSLLDLTLWGPIQTAMESLKKDLLSVMGKLLPTIAQERSAAQGFGKSPKIANDRHLVDLRDLMQRLSGAAGELASVADSMDSALGDAIVANIAGAARPGARGVSVYFPPASDYYSDGYDDIDDVGDWRQVLKTFYDPESAGIDDAPAPPGTLFVEDSFEMTVYHLEGMLPELITYGNAQLQPDVASLIAKSEGYSGSYDATSNAFQVWKTRPCFVSSDEKVVISDQMDGYIPIVVAPEGDIDLFASAESVDLGGGLYLWTTSVPFRYAPEGSSACDEDNPNVSQVLYRYSYNQATGVSTVGGFYVETEAGISQLSPEPGATVCPDLLYIENIGTAQEERVWKPGPQAFAPFEIFVSGREPTADEMALAITAWDFEFNSETIFGLVSDYPVTEIGQ